MNRLTITASSAVLLLALLSGCPSAPEPAVEPPGSGLAAQAEICETLPQSDTGAKPSNPEPAEPTPVPEPEPVPEPQPEPEPEAEPVPESKMLPRMWDYGSEKCIPCKEMEKILTPMMTEYQGRVDIRIINVYEEQEAAKQARIQIIPTQVFYDPDGEELFRHVGAYPRDSILAKFREFGFTE